jgi:hypothetical protein
MNLCGIHSFISISQAFSPAEVISVGVGVLLSVRIPPWASVRTTVTHSQAVIDVRTRQDALIDTFERMENFFQRLEIYTRVSPPPEMIDIIHCEDNGGGALYSWDRYEGSEARPYE